MMILKQFYLSLLFLLIGLAGTQAQETILSSGGNTSISDGSISYSVGQIFYQTNSGTNGSLIEGVQQPYEITVVTAIENTEGITFLVSAYPNPTSDYLILSINEFEISNLSYHIYDLNGKLIESKKIESSETNIQMNKFIPSTYFVKVIEGNKEIKTFKILKN